MNCDNCGRSIKKAYIWNGKQLGQSCYKATNPFYSNPAQAVFIAGSKLLDGDKSGLAVLPSQWRRALKAQRKEAPEHSAVFGGSVAYWMALLARNNVARTGVKVFPKRDLARFE